MFRNLTLQLKIMPITSVIITNIMKKDRTLGFLKKG